MCVYLLPLAASSNLHARLHALPYRVGHNILLAHASAVALFRAQYQSAMGADAGIGITLNSTSFEPYDDSEAGATFFLAPSMVKCKLILLCENSLLSFESY